MLTIDIWPRLAELGRCLPEWLPVAANQRERALVEQVPHGESGADCLNEIDFARAKRACGVLAGAAAFFVLPWAVAVIAAAPFYYVATMLPDIAVKAATAKTERAIDSELPRLAELLAVMTTAGLSPALALPRAVADCTGPLRRSLDTAMAAINLGVPRRLALAEAAGRTPSRDFMRVVELLADAERFGQPLGRPLREMAANLRDKQAAAVRAEAQKLPVKMLFPLVFMILPAFILLSAGPLIISMVK